MNKVMLPFVKSTLILFTFVIIGAFISIEAACCSGAENDQIKISTKHVGKSFNFYLTSKIVIPVTFNISFDKLENLRLDGKLPLEIVIPPEAVDLTILSLSIIDPREASRYEYQFSWSPGSVVDSKHDDTYLYFLPYEHGTKQFADQGYFGSYSHSDPGSEYSIDFGIPEGGKICAARGGIVFDVEESNSFGGPNLKYKKYANYIHVYHSDGSFARYVHLTKNGALVEVGDTVEAGQVIGLSGSTGYSKGAHLHFAVSVADPNAPDGQRSIPTNFLGVHGEAIKIEEGRAYYSFHRGLESFDMTLGSEITNETYRGYSKPLKETGKVEIRSETIDRTIVFFVCNGTSEKVNVSFDFKKIENLGASRKLPVAGSVPPLTERYVLFIRPLSVQEGEAGSYEYTLRYETLR
jgi:murein DD-endopeptidase MepM/ murein hydrolase activator NlpD